MELVHEVRIWIREQVSKEEKCQIWADNQWGQRGRRGKGMMLTMRTVARMVTRVVSLMGEKKVKLMAKEDLSLENDNTRDLKSNETWNVYNCQRKMVNQIQKNEELWCQKFKSSNVIGIKKFELEERLRWWNLSRRCLISWHWGVSLSNLLVNPEEPLMVDSSCSAEKWGNANSE